MIMHVGTKRFYPLGMVGSLKCYLRKTLHITKGDKHCPPKQRYVKNYFPASYGAANKPVTTDCILTDTTGIMIILLFIKHDLLFLWKYTHRLGKFSKANFIS